MQINRLFATAILMIAPSNAGAAQDVGQQALIMRGIAKDLCERPESYGYTRSASGEIGGSLNFTALTQRLGKAGVNAKVAGSSSKWRGVLQNQLASSLASYNTCTVGVLNALRLHFAGGNALNSTIRRVPVEKSFMLDERSIEIWRNLRIRTGEITTERGGPRAEISFSDGLRETPYIPFHVETYTLNQLQVEGCGPVSVLVRNISAQRIPGVSDVDYYSSTFKQHQMHTAGTVKVKLTASCDSP